MNADKIYKIAQAISGAPFPSKASLKKAKAALDVIEMGEIVSPPNTATLLAENKRLEDENERMGMEVNMALQAEADANEELVMQLDVIKKMAEAGQAVVERWDSPKWKDLPHTADYIHRLRKAIALAAPFLQAGE